MKQGRANVSGPGSQKREPISHAVSPAKVSEIGVQVHRHTSLPLYKGRGLEAPMQNTTTHHCGSQGKHK